jgi:hypothetical protein
MGGNCSIQAADFDICRIQKNKWESSNLVLYKNFGPSHRNKKINVTKFIIVAQVFISNPQPQTC